MPTLATTPTVQAHLAIAPRTQRALIRDLNPRRYRDPVCRASPPAAMNRGAECVDRLVRGGCEMASIRKRGSKFQIRYRTLAGVDTSITAPDRDTAKRVKVEVERAHLLGEEWSPGSRDDADQPSLSTVFQAYLDEEDRRLAAGTMRVYTLWLMGFLDHLREKHPRGRLHPSLLTSEALGSYFDTLLTTYAPSSAGKVVRRVIRVWDWAFRRNRRFNNLIPYPEEIALPHTSTALKPWAPSWALADQLIAVCRSAARGKWLGDSLAVQRYTGLRCSQVMRLMIETSTLPNFDSTFGLRSARPRSEKRGRLIPITPHLAEMVEGWGRTSGFLIDTGTKNRLIRNDSLRARWEKAGVKGQDPGSPRCMA